MATYPYQDPQLSITQRVSDLLGRMTLSEKNRPNVFEF
jgi:hypothetical protein